MSSIDPRALLAFYDRQIEKMKEEAAECLRDCNHAGYAAATLAQDTLRKLRAALVA